MNTTEEDDHAINPDVSSFSLSDCTSQDALKKYRVADLKSLLQARGLSKEGRKDDLVKRLWEWAQAEEALKLADEDFDDSQAKEVEATKKQPAEPAVSKKVAPVSEVPKQEIKKVTTPTTTPKQDIVQSPVLKSPANREGAGDSLTEGKMQARVDRFGPVETQGTKLKARAERFGIVDEKSKKQQRQERFGGASSSKSKSQPVVDEETLRKMKERQARFGETTSKVLLKTEEQEAKRRRMEKFGS
jgi:hypothetical protein